MSTAYKLVARKNRPEGSTVSIGGVMIGGPEFVVAAGPCAVESRDQLMQAHQGGEPFGFVCSGRAAPAKRTVAPKTRTELR